jgi:glycosyltransferase involved in cell wall biosynthesis
MPKRITFSVTNDLVYDQRMKRICTALHEAGYDVLLIGRKRKNSIPISDLAFSTKRLNLFFEKGKLFYIEYNIRLFLYLLFVKTDCYCAIDLDSILPNLWVSKIRSIKRVYDAHELFCEMDEITSRPTIHKAWKMIENYAVPKFPLGYTIGDFYALEFKNMYGVQYNIVRNATLLKENPIQDNFESYILYQGAVNEGRCFDDLIEAMQWIDRKLIICGEGNYYEQTKALIAKFKLEHKVTLTGYIKPNELVAFTQKAALGITIFSKVGKSNYLSLANRFFDYMHHGVPQIAPHYPEYIKINNEYHIAQLIEQPNAQLIATEINNILSNKELYNTMQQNTLKCRQAYCWQNEAATLLKFYKNIFG